ncbi:ferric reductase-like transmembrane domain-containing protein [Nocardioides sp. MAHUQ-72]|uniref:ferric reductase-like transmembrane domain-containing protein n=1 Tax=unclassified Nocardioides TaxID=2615069 RepID=UPI00360C61C6
MNEAFWALGRGTGIVALVMFTIALVLGIATRSGRSVGGLGRFGVADVHRTAALTGTGLVAVHVGSLFLDPFAQLHLIDVLFPFLGGYRPLYLGLGTLAVDLLAVVTVVSLLRQRVGPRVFRAVHWLTYLLWPVALVHALGTGTDAGSVWMTGLAATCFAAVTAAVGWRLLPSYGDRGRTRTPRKVSR